MCKAFENQQRNFLIKSCVKVCALNSESFFGLEIELSVRLEHQMNQKEIVLYQSTFRYNYIKERLIALALVLQDSILHNYNNNNCTLNRFWCVLLSTQDDQLNPEVIRTSFLLQTTLKLHFILKIMHTVIEKSIK